jgi:alpha-N-arabinofuranosidase
VHEFADWCKAADTEMMLAVNLGSRGLDAARNFVEYCNHPGGSAWSDLRRKNGRAEPWNVKLWCLGNEMDGPWQVGHKTADEYGKLANETAKALRAFDKSLELVVCGSSHSYMPTFPEWEATVLEHTYDVVDYVSLHMYFANRENHAGNYLALNRRLEEYIDTVAGVIRYIKAKRRSKRDVYISFDEWNVWYHSDQQDRTILDGKNGWPHAPGLLEDIYNFEDVLQVGCILNSFIRRADVVKIACIAQLVNVIAPIMTVKGGPAWRQSTFYPLKFASQHGRGTALNLATVSPTYDAEVGSEIPYLDIAGVDNGGGEISFFAINRSGEEDVELELRLQGYGAPKIIDHQTIWHKDLKASNSAAKPNAVVPEAGKGVAVEDGAVRGRLRPHSYHLIRVKA